MTSSAMRARLNVLPVYEQNAKLTLGDLVAMDIDPNTTIFDLKEQLTRRLTRPHLDHNCEENIQVISLYLVRGPLTDAMTTATVSGAVLCRENYLRVDQIIASCIGVTPSPPSQWHDSDRTSVHVAALAIPSSSGSNVDVRSRAMRLDALLYSEVTDKTLPCTLTASSPMYIRDDAMAMYRRIVELLDLGEAAQNRPKGQFDCVIMTGSRGGGKTEFVWFLLHQLSRTHTVVLDLLDNFLLVRPNGTIIQGDRQHRSFRQELDRPDTIYLAGRKASTSDLLSRGAHKSIIVAEPNRQFLKRLQQSWGRPPILYLPRWSLNDLLECCRRRKTPSTKQQLSTEDVTTLYNHCGGLCQESMGEDVVQTMIRGLQSTIQYLTPDDLYSLSSAVGKPFLQCRLRDEAVILKLLHLTVSPMSGMETATLEYASEFVRREVARRREELSGKCWCRSHLLVTEANRRTSGEY